MAQLLWPPRNDRNRRPAVNPMVVDLLEGKTVFAYIEDRTHMSFGSLYSVAYTHGKILRMHQFDDIDDEVFKGYLIWMENAKSNRTKTQGQVRKLQ
jgi:hypothetical protein